MTKILELREKLRDFYGKYEVYVVTGVKFILSFVAFWLINGNMGYMEKLDNPAVALLLALLCAFLPMNGSVVIGALLILLHLWSLSIEVCLVAAGLFILMFFMYYKFAPKNGYSTIITPIMCHFKLPQAIPVSMGLLREPSAYLSMVCGIITFYYVKGVQENIANFAAVDDNEKISQITMALELLLKNYEMFVVIAAVCITAMAVYVIRRMNINHAWRIAGIVGNTIELVILVIGYILLDNGKEIPWIVGGIALSVIISLILEFFLYNLDYSRVEHVQFEDDEYYYYVKAVPKVYMAEKNKKVKQITPKKDRFSRKELAEELDIDQDLLD